VKSMLLVKLIEPMCIK